MPVASEIRGAFRGAVFASGRRAYPLLEAELEAESKAELEAEFETKETPKRSSAMARSIVAKTNAASQLKISCDRRPLGSVTQYSASSHWTGFSRCPLSS